jgi:hypothetical protein
MAEGRSNGAIAGILVVSERNTTLATRCLTSELLGCAPGRAGLANCEPARPDTSLLPRAEPARMDKRPGPEHSHRSGTDAAKRLSQERIPACIKQRPVVEVRAALVRDGGRDPGHVRWSRQRGDGVPVAHVIRRAPGLLLPAGHNQIRGLDAKIDRHVAACQGRLRPDPPRRNPSQGFRTGRCRPT